MIFIRNLSYVLVLILLSSLIFPALSFPAYASFSSALASPSNTQKENIEFSDTDGNGFIDFDEAGIMLLADNLPHVENTVKRQYVTAFLRYYDMSNVLHTKSVALNSSGYFSFAKPSDLASVNSIEFHLPQSSMPSKAGNYSFSVRFGSNASATYHSTYRLWTRTDVDNVSGQYSDILMDGLQQLSGDFYFSTIMNYQYGYSSSFEFVVYPTKSNIFPYGGYIDLNFTPSKETPDFDTSPSPTTPENIQQNISSDTGQINNNTAEINNNTSQISNNTAEISNDTNDIKDNTAELVSQQVQTNNLIAQIIQTISNQLKAFWDQLAGEFTNLYNKMNAQHDEKLKADKQNTSDLMDNASQNASDMMDNEDKNTNIVINNQNDNREHIENGYDNSSLTNDNNKLNGVLDDYNQAEDTLLKDTKNNLNNFAFDNPFTQFTVVLLDISSILDGIYNGLGAFNIPIGFSLTLTIAMLCIGWYRFKGGA